MGVTLEIRNGPMAGKVIGLKTGESITVGRAAGRAQFALAHDTFMSGLHFAVECSASGCRVVDRKSSNGTFLNGAKIQDALLANGDEIKSGQTIFAVRIVSDKTIGSLNLEPIAPPPEAAVPPQSVSRQPEARPAEPPPPAPPSQPRSQPFARPEEPPSPAVSQPQARLDAEVAPRVAEPERRAPEGKRQDAEVRSPGNVSAEKPAAELHNREMPAKNLAPLVEEPPRVRAIPDVPPRRANAPAGVAPPSVASPAAGGEKQRKDLGRAQEREAAIGSFAFRVMGWSFPAAPAQWEVQEGFGLQQVGHQEFPGSVAATEELLGGITLPQFVESQISTLRGYLRNPKIEPAMPPRVGGADESMAVDVRHSTRDGRELVYRRIYARSGSSVGVLTVTTLAAEFPQVMESLQPLLEGAAFHSTVPV